MASKSVRLVRAGDLLDRGGESEVIRNVAVVLELASGEALTFDTQETVEITDHEDLSQVVAEEENVRQEEAAERARIEQEREKGRVERERIVKEREEASAPIADQDESGS